MKKGIIKLILGAMFIVMAFTGYIGQYNLCYELTFLSNLINGTLLLTDGVFNLCKKQIPHLIYEGMMIPLLAVYSTVIFMLFGIHFNFDGPMMFLHAVDPVIMLLMFLFTTGKLHIKDRKDFVLRLLLTPLPMMAYLLFDLIFYFVNGEFVYGILDAEMAKVYILIPTGIILYGLFVLMSWGILSLKRFTDSHLISSEEKKAPEQK